MAEGNDLKKPFMGQPVWVWAVAGGAVLFVAVYLYRKNAAAQAGTGAAGGSTATAADGAPYQSGVGTFYGWLLDHQSSPTPAPVPAPVAAPKPKPKPKKKKK